MGNLLSIFLSGFIIFCCLIFAYFAQFTGIFNDRFGVQERTIFVGLMLIYAGFRTYRLVKLIRSSKQNKQ